MPDPQSDLCCMFLLHLAICPHCCCSLYLSVLLHTQVKEAVAAGTLTEADLDQALRKTLLMRFITGQFDPPAANPWSSLPVSTVNSKEHRKLARQVVQKGACNQVGIG